MASDPFWSETDSELLTRVASVLAAGSVPGEVLQGIWAGQITALRKPDGGERVDRGGDIFRRLVARTIARRLRKPLLRSSTSKPRKQVASAFPTSCRVSQERTI